MDMRSAKIFLIGMYLYLITQISIPLAILYLFIDDLGISGQMLEKLLGIGMHFFYFLRIAAIQIVGWYCVSKAADRYHQNEGEKLRCSWKLLKLFSIPFYILNFLEWCFLIVASRGLLIFVVVIPGAITCMMIVQSGIVGIYYIKYLRQRPENKGKPAAFHYVLQLISVLNVVSTVIILQKYRISSKGSLPS